MPKYELQCKQCGKPTEISSEYTTFCEHCGKKLSPTFQDWLKQNPSHSLSDYQEKVCINRDEVDAILSKQHRTNKGRNKTLRIVLVSIFVVFTAVFSWLYFSRDKGLNRGLDSNTKVIQDTDAEWVTTEYKDLGVKIETPGVLESVALPLTGEVNALIESQQSYALNYAGFSNLLVSKITFVQNIPLNIENAFKGALNNMQSSPNVSDFSYGLEPFDLDAYEHRYAIGSFTSSDVPMVFHQLIVLKDQSLLQVFVGYPQTDEQGGSYADRILSSLKIEL
jgi:hypothetical protein